MKKNRKILLVEDDLVACRAYQKLLERAGFEVDCALDGEEGLAKSSRGYDCILLDLALPKVDGWQVLTKLKGDDKTKKQPVIVCTVLDGDDYRNRAREMGADGFVNKFNDDILSEVGKILGGIEEISTS